MKFIFDTYEEFRKFTMNSNACPSDLGFCDSTEYCAECNTECCKCWMKSELDIVIKENPKKKISMEFELPMCPYWDPITKTAKHTCGGCHCESEGNTVGNAQYGVMVDGDRYCCLDDDVDIRAGIVEVVKED